MFVTPIPSCYKENTFYFIQYFLFNNNEMGSLLNQGKVKKYPISNFCYENKKPQKSERDFSKNIEGTFNDRN